MSSPCSTQSPETMRRRSPHSPPPAPLPHEDQPSRSSQADTGVPLFPSLARPSCPPTPRPAADATDAPNCPRFTRPHPFLTVPIIYVNSYPPDMPESALADCLKSSLPIRVKMPEAVPPEVRIRPDAYYNWMPRCGTIEFPTLEKAEKALAIMADHPFLTPRGVWVSPFPPQAPPPITENPTTSMFIRQHSLVWPPALPAHPTPEQSLNAYFPTPEEVYDVVRPWGSVKMINTWMLETSRNTEEKEGVGSKPEWCARVEFWYGDEAYRFGEEFAAGGSLIKGWQVVVWNETPMGAPPAHAPVSSAPSLPMMSPASSTGGFFPNIDPAPCFPPGAIFAGMGLQYIPSCNIRPPPLISVPPLNQFSWGHVPLTPLTPLTPQTPTQHDAPPWATHNPYAYVPPLSPPPAAAYTPGHSSVSPHIRRMSRPSSGQRRGDVDARVASHKTWSLTVGETPDGALGPTGLVADDGTVIHHGPGQHIRPAPAFGPGSQSASGLVDYSNVFVKNLDPDINSNYLQEVFESFGDIVSARVMRDETGKSRGYGFVSFSTPEQASSAIRAMNGAHFGRQILSVTHHEPRKLRPEKIAERAAAGGPATLHRTPLPGYLRRSTSPIRGANRGSRSKRAGSEEPKAPRTTEEIRLLSPPSRKLALEKRVTARVRHYARRHPLSDDAVRATVNEIVAHDLEIIPMLYNRADMDVRIAAAVAALHEVLEAPEVQDEGWRGLSAESLGLSIPSSSPGVTTTSSVTPAARLRPTEEDVASLRSQVEAIDRTDADSVMRIMLATLTPAEWETELGSKAGVAIKYGAAKKALLRESQMRVEGSVGGAGAGEQQAMGGEVVGEMTLPAEQENVPLEDITISYLASLPSKTAVALLSGPRGAEIKRKIGLAETDGKERSGLTAWVKRVMAKGVVERKRDIAVVMGRYARDHGVQPRSRWMKVMAELVNTEEDDQALCDLMLFPALLSAKVDAFIASRSPASA